MALKLGLVVANDGEAAVLIPLRACGGEGLINFKSYERACVQLRGNITREEFLSLYGLGDVAEKEKARMVKSLGISEEEMCKAMEKARTDGVECQNLLKVVIACRKESTRQK